MKDKYPSYEFAREITRDKKIDEDTDNMGFLFGLIRRNNNG